MLIQVKKTVVACVVVLGILVGTGCIDSEYVAKKLFWEAEQKISRLVHDKKGQLNEEDYEAIIGAYRRVAEKCPLELQAAKAQFLIANIYRKQGRMGEVKRELEGIAQNFSTVPDIASKARFALGKVFESQDDWQEALLQYEKISDFYPLTPLGLTMPIYILRHYQRQKEDEETQYAYSNGLKHYESLLDDFRETEVTPLVKQHIAKLHLQREKIQQAIATWERVIQDYPQSPHALKALLSKAAVCHKQLGDRPRAIAVYEELIEQFPEHETIPYITFQVASLYMEEEKVEKAEEIFAALLDVASENPALHIKTYLGLASCYKKRMDTDKVMQIYKKIEKEYPRSMAALTVPYLIAQYYYDLKYSATAEALFKDAVIKYQKLLSEDINNETVRREIANILTLCYIKSNQVQKAEESLKKLAAQYPATPMYLLDLALLYRNLNASDKAIGVYEQLMEQYAANKQIVQFATAQIQALRSQNPN